MNNIWNRLNPYKEKLLKELRDDHIIFANEHTYLSSIGPMSQRCDDITDFLNAAYKNKYGKEGDIAGGAAWGPEFYYWYDDSDPRLGNDAEKEAKSVYNWVKKNSPQSFNSDDSFMEIYENRSKK